MNAFDAQSSHLSSLSPAFEQRKTAKSAGSSLYEFIDRLLSALAPSDQPRIRYQERQGQPIWTVYDPMSRRSQQFDSEQAVRIWLEQRYHQ